MLTGFQQDRSPPTAARGRYHSDSNQQRRITSVSHLELNLAPTAEDMPDMALALIRAMIAAADKDQDEMTVLLIHGEPAAVVAPHRHEKRLGAAARHPFYPATPPRRTPGP